MIVLILLNQQNGFQPTSAYQPPPQQMVGGMQQPLYTGTTPTNASPLSLVIYYVGLSLSVTGSYKLNYYC